ncbi:MAG: isoprenylcysteine carboxylmethyltransferase family protein [Candidatus Eisenbacteria bacterium]
MLRGVLLAVVVLFPVSEIVLAVVKRATSRSADVRDRGSLGLLWGVIAGSMCVAVAFRWVPAAAIRAPDVVLRPLALGLMTVGLVVRWTSILTLGRFFTVDVAVQSGHSLVETGLYRHLRHPSYTGLLLVFLGLGVFFANWLSLVSLSVPTTLAVLRRIRVEEGVLRDALGGPYEEYCSRTRRLVPWLF